MRSITKIGNGGYHLESSNQNPPQNHDQARSRWKSFGDKPKLLNHLLTEQYHLCCYSEVRADQLELGYHIEHIENKSQHPQRTFDYTNLAASALESDSLKPFKQGFTEEVVFAGHASGKRNNVDMTQFISPHASNCAHYFVYLSDGRVVAKADLSKQDQDHVQYTIDLLNLNSPFLVNE